jgi:hypothetical protein
VDVGALDRGDRVGDHLGVVGVGGVAGQVDDQQVGVGLDDVDAHHRAAGLADGGGDPPDPERVGAEVDPHGDRPGRARYRHRRLLVGSVSSGNGAQHTGVGELAEGADDRLKFVEQHACLAEGSPYGEPQRGRRGSLVAVAVTNATPSP